MMLPVISRVLSWIATLLTPIAVVLTVARLLASPAFLTFEYNTPNFPQDMYGFTKEDRLYWGSFAVEYLTNRAGIEYLADQRFPDGTPVYNERELSHMVDVKNTVRATLAVWYGALAVLLVLGIWARLGKWWGDYLNGLRRGGWLTVGLLGSIILFVVAAFGVFFVAFHEVFFQPGTWMFLYSDTLIRLFPERFWRDLFIVIGLLSLLAGLALALGLRRRRA